MHRLRYAYALRVEGCAACGSMYANMIYADNLNQI